MHIFEEHFWSLSSKSYKFNHLKNLRHVKGDFKVISRRFKVISRGKLLDSSGIGIYMILKSI